MLCFNCFEYLLFDFGVAIAIHNIPEGIAVSVPIYFATKSKKKAFIYSSLSGLSEPIGALIGYFFFSQYFSTDILSLVFAFVAGIMVFISIDELLPAAQSYGKHHVSINGFITGMVFLAISLILFL
ncbi:MAG: ZIP family metal transporter [Succinivibrionaceae bacterium]|nr:ZIP family metal transporter [Succinivibrionaceae bacterium]